ncbi:MAG: hypothetical protein IKF52_06660 [Clostridia bacterium]|nr:hypothetical protein [Clostridia bacterium]
MEGKLFNLPTPTAVTGYTFKGYYSNTESKDLIIRIDPYNNGTTKRIF